MCFFVLLCDILLFFFFSVAQHKFSVFLNKDERVAFTVVLLEVVHEYFPLLFLFLLHFIQNFLTLASNLRFVPLPQQVQAQIVKIAHKAVRQFLGNLLKIFIEIVDLLFDYL